MRAGASQSRARAPTLTQLRVSCLCAHPVTGRLSPLPNPEFALAPRRSPSSRPTDGPQPNRPRDSVRRHPAVTPQSLRSYSAPRRRTGSTRCDCLPICVGRLAQTRGGGGSGGAARRSGPSWGRRRHRRRAEVRAAGGGPSGLRGPGAGAVAAGADERSHAATPLYNAPLVRVRCLSARAAESRSARAAASEFDSRGDRAVARGEERRSSPPRVERRLRHTPHRTP
jgi:hypothetical protein